MDRMRVFEKISGFIRKHVTHERIDRRVLA